MKGERHSALWGKGGRKALALLAVIVLAAALAPVGAAHHKLKDGPVVPTELLAQAAASPKSLFSVIILGDGSDKSGKLAEKLAKEIAKDEGIKGAEAKALAQLHRQFISIDGIAADLSGKDILKLAKKKELLSISPNERVSVIGPGAASTSGTYSPSAPTGSIWSSTQLWPTSTRISAWWDSPLGQLTPPAIAIVDSGIDFTHPDLAGRVLAATTLVPTDRPNTFPGDGYGHGTFVATVAAGAGPGRAGAAPKAPLVSIDVVDDTGYARTSDVIDAADWILRNKDAYNIRVANFSLHSELESSFMFDPLAQAVERLWQAGVTVVAAAGNYATDGKPSGVKFAPASDPFVITVGALDAMATADPADDVAAPWSSYGYTPDGFAKPEISAPGRYIVGSVPQVSSLVNTRPGNVIGPQLMQMSGTSFSAAMVAGAAANLLVFHPTWTPDQIKGALMVGATALPNAAPLSAGVGELDFVRSFANFAPPTANAALSQFLVPSSSGAGLVFDAASWASAAQSDASWASASWASASWASASWASASWASASWASASWSSASWASASWASASWASSVETDLLAQTNLASLDGLGQG